MGFKAEQFSTSSKFEIFQIPPLRIRQALGSPTFLGSQVSCEQDRQPTISFNIDPEALFVYRMIPK
jgi:hypothetical protein